MRRGRPPHEDILTPREWEVLALLHEGLTNAQIAQQLGISENTAKYHVAEIFSKLDVSDRTEAAQLYPQLTPRSQPARAGILTGITGRALSFTPLKLVGGGIALSVVAVMAAVAIGVVLMSSRGESGTPFAPDGRTGEADIDRVIDTLTRGTQPEIVNRIGEIDAREERQIAVPIPGPGFAFRMQEVRVPPAHWAAQLAAAERSLFAVVEGDGVDAVDVILTVKAGGPVDDAWTFTLRGGRVAEVRIYGGDSPPDSGSYDFALARTPNVAVAYQRYKVLPPQAALPSPTRAHDLAVRTGEASVDGILALLQAKDQAALAASLQAGAALPVQEACSEPSTLQPRADVEAQVRDLAERTIAIQAIADVPAGHQPAADHVVMLVVEVSPYLWGTAYLLEQQGGIVGCIPPSPPDFIVAPPQGGLAGLSLARRSGIAVIDAALDALRANDAVALRDLIDPSLLACPGEYGPPCLPGEPAGTEVEVLPGAVCHGEYPRLEEAGVYLAAQNLAGLSLYSVTRWETPPGIPPLHSKGNMTVLLMDSSGQAALLGFSDLGITHWSRKCGPPDPQPPVPPGLPTYVLPPLL